MIKGINTTVLTELLEKYADKHELVIPCDAEYIYQDDDAQVDAIELVAEIFEKAVSK